MKQAHLFISLAIFLLAGISCTGRISSSKVQSKVETKLAPEYEDVEKKFVNLSDFPTDAEGGAEYEPLSVDVNLSNT